MESEWTKCNYRSNESQQCTIDCLAAAFRFQIGGRSKNRGISTGVCTVFAHDAPLAWTRATATHETPRDPRAQSQSIASTMAAMLRRVRNTVIKTAAAGTILVGTVEVTTHLPSEGRSSRFYHSLIDDMVTPLMRRVLDPETAHHSALEFARRGWAPTFRPSAAECSIKTSIEPLGGGLVFGNCIGLAAGFDKDGDVIKPMLDLGFGFVEIGSVTPEPQPGNPKPRMFRLTEDLGVINRYGFNSIGADAVEEHLRRFRKGPPVSEEGKSSNTALQRIKSLVKACVSIIRPTPREQLPGVVGVNLGKNKDSEDEIAVSPLDSLLFSSSL